MVQLARALLVLAFAVCGGLGFAADVPPLTGVFNDPSSVVSIAKRDEITAFLREREAKTSNQIVVLVVKTLGGDTVEDFANRVFREWKLGQAGKDNGVLLLVASQDGQARIEVGRGLQGTLTDIVSKRILDEKAIPNFKERKFGSGILASVQAIDAVIKGEYKSDEPSSGYGWVIFATVVLAVLVVIVVMALMTGISPPPRLETAPAYTGRRSSGVSGYAGGPSRRRRRSEEGRRLRSDDERRSRSDDDIVPVVIPASTSSHSDYASSRSDPEPAYSGGGGVNDGGGASAGWDFGSSGGDSGGGGGDGGGGGGSGGD